MPGLAIRALIVSLLCSPGKLLFVRGTPVRISFPLRGLGSLFIVPHTPHLLSQRTSSLLHLSRLCITSEPGARSIPCVCTHNSAFVNDFFDLLPLRSLMEAIRVANLCVSTRQASSWVPSMHWAPTWDSRLNDWILQIELNSTGPLVLSQKKRIIVLVFQTKRKRMVALKENQRHLFKEQLHSLFWRKKKDHMYEMKF